MIAQEASHIDSKGCTSEDPPDMLALRILPQLCYKSGVSGLCIAAAPTV